MDLDTAVDELYGLEPSEFTARRDTLAGEARKAGDRGLAASLKSLRRPSAAAHAVNLMARTRGEEIDRLLHLGERLREAQAALSGDDLRTLGRQRQQVVAGLAQEARRVSGHAGHPLSDAVAREVEATFEAVLADEAAGEVVRQGRLVRALERSGMDPVDLEGAVAGRPPAPVKGPARAARAPGRDVGDTTTRGRAGQQRAEEDRKRGERAAAKEAAQRAEEAARRAREGLARAAADHEEAARRREDTEQAVARLERQLIEARREADRAAAEERRAGRALRQVEEETEVATTSARRARQQADDLEP